MKMKMITPEIKSRLNSLDIAVDPALEATIKQYHSSQVIAALNHLVS
jgi:hypothetical protein